MYFPQYHDRRETANDLQMCCMPCSCAQWCVPLPLRAGRPDFDLVIVRPSIISAAADEVLRNPSRPNFAGLNGILALSACGYDRPLPLSVELG